MPLIWHLIWRAVCWSESAKDFYSDWFGVADDESRHFLMLSDRPAQLGATYGDLPAHDGPGSG